jgi:hypothetical protein
MSHLCNENAAYRRAHIWYPNIYNIKAVVLDV